MTEKDPFHAYAQLLQSCKLLRSSAIEFSPKKTSATSSTHRLKDKVDLCTRECRVRDCDGE